MAEQVLQHGRVGQVRGRLEMHPHEEQTRGILALHVAELL
jgi:hypothetical protein